MGFREQTQNKSNKTQMLIPENCEVASPIINASSDFSTKFFLN